MAVNADKRRRCLGALFLLVALVMLIAGQTVLRERLGKVGFVVFWMVCFVFTMAAVFVAFLDAAATRRRAQEEQRTILRDAVGTILSEQTKRSGKSPKGKNGSQ